MKLIWLILIGSLLLASRSGLLSAQTVIFEENFDQLPLDKPVQEDSSITQAFTHSPPDNWRVDSSGVPGVQNPSIGVFEWEGWSFANKDFWIEVSGNERRSEFKKAEGTLAVADPDEWNDLGDPANNVGFFKTFLKTPVFNIGGHFYKKAIGYSTSWTVVGFPNAATMANYSIRMETTRRRPYVQPLKMVQLSSCSVGSRPLSSILKVVPVPILQTNPTRHSRALRQMSSYSLT